MPIVRESRSWRALVWVRERSSAFYLRLCMLGCGDGMVRLGLLANGLATAYVQASKARWMAQGMTRSRHASGPRR